MSHGPSASDPYGVPCKSDNARGHWEAEWYRALYGKEMPDPHDPEEQSHRREVVCRTFALSRGRKFYVVVSSEHKTPEAQSSDEQTKMQ